MTASSKDRRLPTKAADDGLDVIPMNKTSPMVFLVIGGGLLVVAALAVWGVAGRLQGDKAVAAIKAQVEASAVPSVDPKVQREHIAMTQRALAAAEEKKKEKEAEEAAAKQAEAEVAEAAEQPAGPAGAGAPPPISKAAATKAASDLDSLGDDIASQLK
ncbi:MAG: hypothetical protein JW751_24460 [Polyangiaceae bacterium]|nr:hypothetical protein [Polyangiaceae bacterium]